MSRDCTICRNYVCLVKGSEVAGPEVKTRKKWALWTVEEKNQFFDALLEVSVR